MSKKQSSCRLVMAQLNPLVGDITGNQALIRQAIIDARDKHNAAVIVFSELIISGYPPEDLLLQSAFSAACEAAVTQLAGECIGITAIIGCPQLIGDDLYNAALVLQDGQVSGIARKQCLPNYGVFDEQRYFISANETLVISLPGALKAGITICEDIWSEQPANHAYEQGANLLINLNASPFHAGKYEDRLATLRRRLNETGLPVIYVNQVGGQDELVFDGGSFVLDASGAVVVQAPVYETDLYVVDIDCGEETLAFEGEKSPLLQGDELIYATLVQGVRDYVHKNGFAGAVLGLSGGIDSALTLAIAVDALGAASVSAIMMPYKYTSSMSLEDAQAEAVALGIDYRVIPIEPAFNAFSAMLAPIFENSPKDVTEENLQARSRGVVLMAISNKLKKIVLTTGNKSEMAVGYATLYGDMAGGFAPLKDVYKTSVYRLCNYRNSISPVIPQRVIDRPPSAELAPDQVDQDSLPDYSILDDILGQYIERHASVDEIASAGHDITVVQDAIRKVDFNEYKRRQAPPGIKITERAFGRDRRYPITAKK